NKYKIRLLQVADNMVNRLAASAPQQAIGFVEKYNSSWQPDNSQTMTIMGHVLKTAWCLARVFEIQPDSIFLTTAKQLTEIVLTKGYDHVFGGPYKDYNRITGEMLMWGQTDTAKAWWQMEQAITSGLFLYHITDDTTYLQMADETINFFMRYFVDHVYGDVFSDRTRYGNQIWGLEKGNDGKAGYHSIELGYYSYIYGKLFFKNEPITLYYNFQAGNQERTLTMKPLEAEDGELSITGVKLNGVSYYNYDGNGLTLNIPSGSGGIFAVTYELNAPSSVSATINYSLGWNLVSLPVRLGDATTSIVFPNSTSSAFSYNDSASYQVSDSLTVGKGYWLKFGSSTLMNIAGLNVTAETIAVNEGWNLIGSISSNVSVENIISIPGGLVTTDFYGYSNGYVAAWTIESGKGYWVKVSQTGQLVLSSSATNSSNKIQIVSSNELPPAPPNEMNSKDPLIPNTFALYQNYPNPFNPTTVITYQLPFDGFVRLKIYSMLGEEVATLVEGIQHAGYKSITWDASAMPTGVYYYRITWDNIIEMKKMLLIR
ncbi:MAG: AGE family epimerase/isomerase, partial [Ignavibacteriae bacterium]|nr:AGE family epimerase/isomerase [Ignavibacteriota bacterium]